jgi:anti-sigma factor RsiW
MRCKTAERWLLLSQDGRLDERLRGRLSDHLEACPKCRKAQAEYGAMAALLKNGKDEEPLPRFWERLEPRLEEEEKAMPFILWERLSLRSLPVFLLLVAAAAGLLFLTPQAGEATASASETLLLQNTYSMTEAQTLFDQKKGEDRTMMLIFASLDEPGSVRRRMP